MRIEPVKAAIGATIHDVNLNSLSEAEVAEINAAWATYGVLFFRDQELSPDQHLVLAQQLGEIGVNRFFAHIDGFDMIACVVKEPTDELNIGGGWHTDHSYDSEPAKGSILVARDLPPTGGDTQFISAESAWRTLPEEMKERVKDLVAVHSSEHVFGAESSYAKRMGPRFGNSAAVNTNEHPMVIAHPVTGNPILFVNPGFTTGIVGMERDAARVLLKELYSHMLSDDHMYQFQWAEGSVAMWDNRSTWHHALNDYPGHRRAMHRITLAGVEVSAAREPQAV